MKIIGYVGDVVEGFAGVVFKAIKYMIVGSLLGALIISAILGTILYTM